MNNSGRPRVVVAMSGGVDSSVAAALLVEQGYEVIGIMMRLWAPEGYAHNRCCSPESAEDARRVAQMLGVPFYILNYEETFRTNVFEYFRSQYLAGRTPNPCLKCNRHLKFGVLLAQARALGAEYLATGHYARVGKENSTYHLLKAKDHAKDQSYALYMLGQEELAHVFFPVGQYTKEEVRAIAQRHDLPVAGKEDSQELCFIPSGHYGEFLEKQGVETLPGLILDESGRVLGQHRGLIHYTIGQRKGLGISSSQPLYVLALDSERNALIVGPEDRLGQREAWAQEVSYTAGHPPHEPLEVMAKVRYKAQEALATLFPEGDGRARLVFSQPQRAVAPGQGVVFYQEERVIGGGIIESAA